MTEIEAIAALDAINPAGGYRDPEEEHCQADGILLDVAPPDVRAAYIRVVERAESWWFA